MKAIFYDRKHNCNVSSDQLIKIDLGHYLASGDNDDQQVPTGRRFIPNEFGLEAIDLEFYQKYYHDGGYSKYPSFGTWKEETTPRRLFLTRAIIGEIGYKTPECPDYQNWDRWLMLSDLVFLKLEE